MNEVKGQILLESRFGKTLTELAKHSEIIVEIGTWRGLGSTLCLASGIFREGQRMVSVESAEDKWREAVTYYNNPQIQLVWGTIVKEIQPYEEGSPELKDWHAEEFRVIKSAPFVLDQIPEKIDLLLLDGGNWTSEREFDLLRDRCSIIALDDTNRQFSVKNWRNRDKMINGNWATIADHMDDRNGWFIGRRL